MKNSQSLHDRLARLKRILARMGSAVIGFSGGVDSAFLCRVARDTLGKQACAVTVVSDFFPCSEKKNAVRLAAKLGLRHECAVARMPETCLRNTVDRCYHCKKFFFSRLKRIAGKNNIAWVVDGSNIDDRAEFRPGKKALKELGVRSPLQEAGFTKEDIRRAARDMGIDVWDRPSYTCLATRIPFGLKITPHNLAMVEQAEEVLQGLGFRTVRVRYHQELARIEVPHKDISRLLRSSALISDRLKHLGFRYVSVDLEGYRGCPLHEGQGWRKKK